MNVNPINFKGVYHYQINTKQDFRKFQSLLSLQELEGSDFKFVIGHQNYQSVAQSLLSCKERYEDVPGVEWMIQHAKYKDIELPKYFTNGDYDIYILTDKDKRDYEKTLEKRERPMHTKKILREIYRQTRQEEDEDDLIIDILLKRLSAFAKNEIKEFNAFLEKRKVEPMNIEFLEDDSAIVHLD